MKNKWFVFVLLALVVISCKKQIVHPSLTNNTRDTIALASVFQSNMIVQRDKPLTIRGTSKATAKVSVNVSWDLETYNVTADKTGNWAITIAPASATAIPQTIIAKAGNSSVALTNILIGDVWICSGQSNMAMPLDSIVPFRGVLNYRAEIAAANYPSIRLLTVKEDHQDKPLTDLTYPAPWAICSPATAGGWSAVAYFFARKLHTSLNIPIGIIVSAVNGSWCQDWTNAAVISSDPYLNQVYSYHSSMLYNGMINPLTGLQVSGFIWYQGENNEHDDPPSGYTRINEALVKGWRSKFNQSQLPFYFVQMTPFAEDYNSTSPPGGDLLSDYYAKFREAQANVLTTPATGMAVTMDVGEADNHHPRNKKPVGERLALLALKNTYDQNVECYGPRYSSFSVNGYTATVNFAAGTANGLNTANSRPLNQFFFVAGSDHIFRQATAAIAGSTIVLSAPPGTPLPIQAIRYAFTNAPMTNLQNSAGLPAEPFRTDDWNN